MHVLFGEERRGDCLDSLESSVCVCVCVCVCLMQCMVLGSQVTPRSLSVRLSGKQTGLGLVLRPYDDVSGIRSREQHGLEG